VIPFVAEEIWGNLTAPMRERGSKNAPESVHLTDYPESLTELIDEAGNLRMAAVLRAVSLGRAAREKVQIKVRQPLATMWLVPLAGRLPDFGDGLMREMAEELNVKAVRTDRAASEVGEAQIKLNFPVLGKRLGQAVKAVQTAAKEGRWALAADGRLSVEGHELEKEEFEIAYLPRPGLALAHDHSMMVALDTEIGRDLLIEGYARELIRGVQDLRKKAGYQVEDRISLCCDGSEDVVAELLDRHGAGIAGETLATEILRERGDVDQECMIDLEPGLTVWVGVRR
jgi:isoleucyl-tRNA synthetase